MRHDFGCVACNLWHRRLRASRHRLCSCAAMRRLLVALIPTPLCGMILGGVSCNLWHRRLRAPRHRLCSCAAMRRPVTLIPVPRCGVARSSLFLCLDVASSGRPCSYAAMRQFHVVGCDMLRPWYARSAYWNIACGKARSRRSHRS